jgi:hypothetical protein
MANPSSTRRAESAKLARSAANDEMSPDGGPETSLPQSGSPANDNPAIIDLPTCLAVTDEEVRLLHRYLGRKILALFG